MVIAIAGNAQSPVSISKKVATLPVAFEKPTDRTNVFDDGKKTSLPWIVFSDREENFTTTAPGGSLVMKKLKFMEPFYVSESRNGYIKLIKYQPGMVQGRKLTNKKAAQSYGWISRNKVLLWQSAYVNPSSGYPQKAVAIISGAGTLTNPELYYDRNDSVYVYNTPELEHKKSKIALNELLYIYKRSPDAKTLLVGSDPQLVPDSAKQSMFGWVPSDAVHSWGDRLYIGSAKTFDTDADDSVAAVINQSLQLQPPANNGKFAFDPLIDADQPVLRTIPVIDYNDDANLKLGIATDVYDKSNNSIINIKGGHITYKQYLAIRKGIRKINVVFVIDGGSSMRNYFSGITSSIKSFENVFDNYNQGRKINYGVAVYRNQTNCSTGGVERQDFNTDYRKVVSFLEKQSQITNQCIPSANTQPVFDGIRSALAMFANHKNETNLVVLIGSTGNENADANAVADLSSEIATADARILAIQVYADYNAIYNDFVIQSRKLVSESAAILADRKKNRMVVGEGLSNTQQFNVSLSDSISFYLDFPKNSLIQGAVVFPPKGAVKSNLAMEASLKRFMAETQADIRMQTRSLDSVFRLTGREHRYVTPVVMSQFSSPPATLGDDMPHNGFKYFIAAGAPSTIVSSHPGKLQYLIILNEDEYKQMNDILSMLIGENLEQDAGSFRSKLRRNYIDIIKKNMGLKMSSGDIKKMRLSDYLRKATGLVMPAAKQFGNYTVGNLSSTSDMPQPQFEAYINYLIKCRNTIKQQALVQQRFTSNGKTYYYITQENWQQ